MKIKLKLLVVVVIIGFVLSTLNPFMSSFFIIKNEERRKQQWVTVNTNQQQKIMEIDEYLVGVVAAEMPAYFEVEALKAQAVASRTFVTSRKYLVDDTTASQVYQDEEKLRKKWNGDYEQNIQKIRQAVQETEGKVLTYQNEIISATFFSSSNGKTNNSQDYWSGKLPYLVSVDSHWDHQKKDNIRRKTLTKEQLEAIFSTLIDEIVVVSHYNNGYVKEVRVNQSVMSGRQMREILALSSSSFEIVTNKDTITFITSGSGHGVGMSQYGAQGMAKEGYTYDQILKHYYKGVEIVNK